MYNRENWQFFHLLPIFLQIRNNSKIVDLWEITYVRNGIEKKTTLTFG